MKPDETPFDLNDTMNAKCFSHRRQRYGAGGVDRLNQQPNHYGVAYALVKWS